MVTDKANGRSGRGIRSEDGKTGAKSDPVVADAVESPIRSVLRGNIPDWLAQNPVYRNVPVEERARLDRAILIPGEGNKSLEAIAAEFKLEEKYGITPAMLKTYAGKLEELMMPTVRSQVMAAIMSCMPEEHRHKLLDGSQVLLLSQVLAALTNEHAKLSLAEMGKVAAVLMSMGKERATARGSTPKPGQGCGTDNADGADLNPPAKLAESVRMVYGLEWPPRKPKHNANIQENSVESPTPTGIG